MMRSINVAIPDDAANKLSELARREFRRPRDQAAVLLVDALKRLDIEGDVRSEELESLDERDVDR